MDIQVIWPFTVIVISYVLFFFVQSEMKIFGWYDTEALKKHYGKKIRELEEEKRIVQVIIN